MNKIGLFLDTLGLTEQASQAESGVWYSIPEVRLAEALTARGFAYEQQKRVSRGGRDAILDFLVEGVVAVEVDGKDFHNARKDSQRDYEVWFESGIHTFRVPAWRVMRDAEAVVCRIALRLSELQHKSELRAETAALVAAETSEA